MATIYKKTSSRPLSLYQKRMNEASQKICLKNPGLLRSHQKMMECAREKIMDEGFQFVKGKSRSKKKLTKCFSGDEQDSSTDLEVKTTKAKQRLERQPS